MSDTTKYLLTEEDLPKDWYNIAADLPSPLPPPLHPGTGQPIGPQDLAPLFPMEVIKQEVSHGALGSRFRKRSATSTGSGGRLRSTARTGWRRALGLPERRPHLLQVRGRQPVRQSQTEHRRAAGLLQQAGGCEADRDRDRRRSMGQFAGDGLRVFRHRAQGLHGQDQLRPEAVPAGADGDLGRDLRAQSRARTPMPAARSWPRIRNRPGRSGSRSPRRSRTPRPAKTPSTRSVGPQSRADASDRDRTRSAQAARDGRRLAGCRDRLRGRRLELRRAGAAVRARKAGRQSRSGSSPPNRPPARR